MSEPTVTRRALLGAAALLPLVGCGEDKRTPAGRVADADAATDRHGPVAQARRGRPGPQPAVGPGQGRPLHGGRAHAELLRHPGLRRHRVDASSGDLLERITTGDNRIRAGLPRTWTVADRTGTGNYGTIDDIAIAWPPRSAPLVAAALS